MKLLSFHHQILTVLLCFSLSTAGIHAQKYFQQEVNYSIDVRLDDQKHELSAFQTIEYINNSPDTLPFLFFHLWPNAYLNNNTSLARQLQSAQGKSRLFEDPELQGYIDSLDFRVAGKQLEWHIDPHSPDICQLILNTPLMPGDTVQITTPFRVKLPKGVTSRLGHVGQSYQISQWYPKPAVYDPTGWNPMPYLDQGEFYAEFGRFDVRITLPENYLVGASGDLQNESEQTWLSGLAADSTWKNVTSFGRIQFPQSSDKWKTLHYTGNQMHDFAWFADKRYHVMKGQVRMPASGREVATWVMFTDREAHLWKNALEYMHEALLYFSETVGDYPYNSLTAVQGELTAGAGMEYPGLAVIGLTADTYALDAVLAHEIGHVWFYGALGFNERRFPFLDEGITSAFEMNYSKERHPDVKLWETLKTNPNFARIFRLKELPVERMYEIDWLVQSRNNTEQAIDLPATDYTETNYYNIIYNKAALGFNYLKVWMGDSLYHAAMQDFYQTWQFKHPQPDDLRRVFEKHSPRDVDWFFDDFLGSTKRLDYQIKRYENGRLLVKNNKELMAPFIIVGMKGDSVCFERWVDGFEGEGWVDLPEGDYSEIVIDPGHVMPEYQRLNNRIRTSGLFPKHQALQTRFLFTIEDPGEPYLVYTPIVNWNKEDGLMPGLLFHNGVTLPKPLEYTLMPFYSFKASGLMGFGQLTYNLTPYNHFVRKASFSMEGSQFGAPGNKKYQTIKGGMDVYFRNSIKTSPFRHSLFTYFIAASDLAQVNRMEAAKMNYYFQLGYRLTNNRSINPYNLLTTFESHKNYHKASVEYNYTLSFYEKDQGLDVRLLAGTMLKNAPHQPFYAFAPGGRGGKEQYLYEGSFIDRFSDFPNGFFSRQMTLSEGGLVSPVNDSIGYSSSLLSLSLTSHLPGRAGRLPVKPFVNFVVRDSPNNAFFYEAGLKTGIWDFFEIHIPLLVSENIQSATGPFKERIRFTMNLDALFLLRFN
ncbi:MAG: M1 family metallopeptidase [Bacteroidales bacterium]|nr:M1 family metallopeptidase [Bacteroidales bacterium]